MKSVYLQSLLESEEMQYYINNFGGGVLKKNKTREMYKNMSKEVLLELYEEVKLKKSNLPTRERNFIIYFAEKLGSK